MQRTNKLIPACAHSQFGQKCGMEKNHRKAERCKIIQWLPNLTKISKINYHEKVESLLSTLNFLLLKWRIEMRFSSRAEAEPLTAWGSNQTEKMAEGREGKGKCEERRADKREWKEVRWKWKSESQTEQIPCMGDSEWNRKQDDIKTSEQKGWTTLLCALKLPYPNDGDKNEY